MINDIYLDFKKGNHYYIDLKEKFGFINIDWPQDLTLSNFFYSIMNSILLGKDLPLIDDEIYKNYSIVIKFDNKYQYELKVEDNEIKSEQLFRLQKLLLIDTNRKYNFYNITKDGFDRNFDIDEVTIEKPEIPGLLFDFKDYFPHINCLQKDITDWGKLTDKQFTKLNKLIKFCFNEVKSVTIIEGVYKKLQVNLKYNDSSISADNMGSGFNCLIKFFPNLINSVKNDILVPNINCSDIYSLHPILVKNICTLLSKYRIQVFLDVPVSGCTSIIP